MDVFLVVFVLLCCTGMDAGLAFVIALFVMCWAFDLQKQNRR